MTTFELEQAIYFALAKMGTYVCFEVQMPRASFNIGLPDERVDLLTFDTKGDWRFYELKISKRDFYSKHKHTFYGDFNYFVMPHDVYLEVKHDIPNDIGAYTAKRHEPSDKIFCECVRKPKRRQTAIHKDKLMFAFMQALSREHGKYRRLLAERSGKC